MKPEPIKNGITMFEGKLSNNLLLKPMVSNVFFLEDKDEVIVFDPSCGKEVAETMKSHLKSRQAAGKKWKYAFVIAGHSHVDHANNFAVADQLNAEETAVYVHEAGFVGGKVMNNPAEMFETLVTVSERYFNRYLSFYFPYNLILTPFFLLSRFMPGRTRKLFAYLAALSWPGPNDGKCEPTPLLEKERQPIRIGEVEASGWRIGTKFVLATPGHSPCSVSLFWPEKKALFVSDAYWIGNPVFMFSSIKDCITSLNLFKALAEAGMVDLFLPAHGYPKKGAEEILTHIRFEIERLKSIRCEVLSAYEKYGEKDVKKLTKQLVRESPLIKMLKLTNNPRLVLNVHDTVALCLRESGIIN